MSRSGRAEDRPLQVAAFFASDGSIMEDPDGAGPFFETSPPTIPDGFNFIP